MVQPISMLPRRKTRKRGAAKRRQFIQRAFVVLLILSGAAWSLWYWFGTDRNAAPSDLSSVSDTASLPSASTTLAGVYGDPEAPTDPASEDTSEAATETAYGVTYKDTSKTDIPSDVTDKPAPPEQKYPPATLEAAPPVLADSYVMVEDAFFDDAFFIGDSITTGLAVFEPFDHRAVLAKKGLTLKDAAEEVAAYADYGSRKIFILLGANDITYYDMTEALYAERYGALIDILRQIFPEAKIYVQGILPVTNDYTGNESLTNERIFSYNQALESLATEKDVAFVDIAAAWRLSDHSLHPEVSGDGLHILFQYYGTWLQILKDHAQ